MNVGIITFHHAHNYGAILQGIALCYAVRNAGFDCNIIDYRNKRISAYYHISWRSIFSGILHGNFRNILKIPGRIVLNVAKEVRKKRFNRSIAMLCAPQLYSPLKFDAVIFGSDQIWNGIITGNDKVYYGEIDDDNGRVRKIAYSASLGFGNTELIVNNRTLLQGFQAISVRENSLKGILYDNDVASIVTVDPSLLLTSKDWDKLLGLENKLNKEQEYIFVYAIRNRGAVLSLAHSLSKKYGLPIKEPCSFESFNLRSVLTKSGYAKVEQFVELLRNSKFVVTDSFHGTAFSTIYRKNFYSVRLGDKGDDRIASMLFNFNLDKYFVDPQNIETDAPLVDYTDAEKPIEKMRTDSIDYIKQSLR